MNKNSKSFLVDSLLNLSIPKIDKGLNLTESNQPIKINGSTNSAPISLDNFDKQVNCKVVGKLMFHIVLKVLL